MPSRFWLCLPPVLFALIDYLITMAGQPVEYWAGDYDAALESNPIVRWCMTVHPSLFHGLSLVWIVGFAAVIVKTPRPVARFVSLAIAFGHAFCIGTWVFEGGDGFLRSIALCIACTIVCVMALELSGE